MITAAIRLSIGPVDAGLGVDPAAGELVDPAAMTTSSAPLCAPADERGQEAPRAGAAGLVTLLAGSVVIDVEVAMLRVAAAVDGVPPLPLHPIRVLVALQQGGQRTPPRSRSPSLATCCLRCSPAGGWAVTRRWPRRSRVDRAASKMVRGADIPRLGHREATATSTCTCLGASGT